MPGKTTAEFQDFQSIRRFLNGMHYVNPCFTYSLTYLLPVSQHWSMPPWHQRFKIQLHSNDMTTYQVYVPCQGCS